MATRSAVSWVLWSLSVSITSARSTSCIFASTSACSSSSSPSLDEARRCCRWRGSGSRRRPGGSGCGPTPAGGPGRPRCERSGWASRRPWRCSRLSGTGAYRSRTAVVRQARRLAAGLDSAGDRSRTDRRAAAGPPARSRRRRGRRGARRPIAQRRARALPGAGAAGHAGARLPRPALARRGRGGARAGSRRRRRRPRSTRCCSSRWRCSGRPGEPPYAEHTLVDQAVAAARAARRRRGAGFVNAVLRRFVREREALVAAVARRPGGALQPSAVVDRAPARRLARPLAGDRRRRQRPSADDACASTRGAATAGGVPRRARRRTASPAQAARRRTPSRCVRPVPVAAAARLRRGRGVGAGRRRAARRAAAAGGAARRRARACSTPAPRRAARPRTCSSWPTSTCWRSTATRRGWPASTRPWPASACAPRRCAADAARRRRAGGTAGRSTAILLDAPCSASGIVRRHPDVRWLRRAERHRRRWRATQARLLDALWPLLAPGGRLLYSPARCSGPRARTQIDAFLQRQATPAARRQPAFARAPAAAARQ